MQTAPKANNKDFDFFQKKLPELLKDHLGQFALIKDEKIIGFYPSFEEALKDGVDRFGTSPFIVQEITNEQRTNYLSSWLLQQA